jgi:hypothetical protein
VVNLLPSRLIETANNAAGHENGGRI